MMSPRQIYGCKNIVKDNTCYKNPINGTCIDLIITNRTKSFHKSKVIETGLPDFHKKSLTVMKVFSQISFTQRNNEKDSFKKRIY